MFVHNLPVAFVRNTLKYHHHRNARKNTHARICVPKTYTTTMPLVEYAGSGTHTHIHTFYLPPDLAQRRRFFPTAARRRLLAAFIIVTARAHKHTAHTHARSHKQSDYCFACARVLYDENSVILQCKMENGARTHHTTTRTVYFVLIALAGLKSRAHTKHAYTQTTAVIVSSSRHPTPPPHPHSTVRAVATKTAASRSGQSSMRT